MSEDILQRAADLLELGTSNSVHPYERGRWNVERDEVVRLLREEARR